MFNLEFCVDNFSITMITIIIFLLLLLSYINFCICSTCCWTQVAKYDIIMGLCEDCFKFT